MKVDVLIPRYKTLKEGAHNAIARMCAFSKQNGIDLAEPILRSSSLIEETRNMALSQTRKDVDYILFCDDDMVPEHDSLVRLVKHELPLVSALTTTKDILPPMLSVRAYSPEEDRFVVVEQIRPNAVVKGQLGVGCGFMMFSREVRDAVVQEWHDARDWAADHEDTFKRLHVPVKMRDKERQRMAELRKGLGVAPQVFSRDTTKSGHKLGEDISFCRRVLRLGYEIAVDTSVQVGHLGDFPYGPWNLGHNDHKELRFDSH